MKRAALSAIVLAGCVNEYHPEFHPVSIVSVEQREEARAPRETASAPEYMRLFPKEKRHEDPFVEDASPIATSAPIATSVPVALPQRRGSVYIGGNVRIEGNVTIYGDVIIDATSR
jgi:UDP-3-O-[3-hydroxymyristoyl] glucosamine N-acyltransferase